VVKAALLMALIASPIASAAGGPTQAVLASARIVIATAHPETPQVVLTLPAGFHRGAANANAVLTRFRGEVIDAFDLGVRMQMSMGMPLRSFNPAGVEEQATILLYGTGPGQSQEQFGFPRPLGSSSGDTQAQLRRYRTDIVAALDGKLAALGWHK